MSSSSYIRQRVVVFESMERVLHLSSSPSAETHPEGLPFPLSPDSPLLNNHHHPPEESSNTLQQQQQTMQHEQIIVGILIGVISFLSIVLLCLVVPPAVRWIRSKLPVDPQIVSRRYETIERWMITKRVRAHDDACHRCRCSDDDANDDTTPKPQIPITKMTVCCEISSPPPMLEACPSYDTVETSPLSDAGSCTHNTTTDEDDDREEQSSADSPTQLECPICLEEFQKDEIVSWSTNTHCKHVFHHECIKEWLLRRTDCPFCRKTFLTVDDLPATSTRRNTFFWKQSQTPPALQDYIQEWKRRVWSTYFCQQHGLVECSHPSHDTTARKRLLAPRVQRAELVQLRGGREDPQQQNNNKTLSEDEEPV